MFIPAAKLRASASMNTVNFERTGGGARITTPREQRRAINIENHFDINQYGSTRDSFRGLGYETAKPQRQTRDITGQPERCFIRASDVEHVTAQKRPTGNGDAFVDHPTVDNRIKVNLCPETYASSRVVRKEVPLGSMRAETQRVSDLEGSVRFQRTDRQNMNRDVSGQGVRTTIYKGVYGTSEL